MNNKKSVKSKVIKIDEIDIEFKSDDEVLDWLRWTSLKLLKLAFRDSKSKTLKLKRHQSSHRRNRLSSLEWVWVPHEGRHILFEFDTVCMRLGRDPDDLRKKFLARMTTEEIQIARDIRPYLFD